MNRLVRSLDSAIAEMSTAIAERDAARRDLAIATDTVNRLVAENRTLKDKLRQMRVSLDAAYAELNEEKQIGGAQIVAFPVRTVRVLTVAGGGNGDAA